MSISSLTTLPKYPLITTSRRFATLTTHRSLFATYGKNCNVTYIGYTPNLHQAIKHRFITSPDSIYYFSYLPVVDLEDHYNTTLEWSSETNLPFNYDNYKTLNMNVNSSKEFETYMKTLFKERGINSGYRVTYDGCNTITAIL